MTATLLTGATGYLGGYAAAELLARGERVLALVRARDGAHARERIWRGLQLHLAAPTLRDHLDAGRLVLLTGDVREPGLGLAPAARERVLAEADGVIHAAATLNRRSARSCADVNLRGGLEAILLGRDLAERGRLRRFTFVSTVAVAGQRAAEDVREDDAVAWDRSDWDPYARTKKVGEQLVRRLLPPEAALIVRPAIVMGDSRRPETTQFDMVQAFVRLAQCPALPFDPAARLDIVPADFTGEALARLHLLEAPRHDAYHLSAGAGSPTFRDVARALAAQLGRREAVFLPRLGPAAGAAVRFAAGLRRGAVSRFASLLDVFWPYLEWDVVFDNTRVTTELGVVPAPFTSYCGGLFRFAVEGGFRYPHRPLPPLLAEPAPRPRRARALPVARAGEA